MFDIEHHAERSTDRRESRLWAPGLAVGAIAAGAMVGPSLFPKNPKLQAVGIAAAAAVGFGVGVGMEGIARRIDDVLPGDRLAAQGMLAGVGVALAAGVHVATRGQATGLPAMAKSVGLILAAGGAAGAASTLVARSGAPGSDGVGQVGVAAIAGAAVLTRSAALLRANRGAQYLLPDLPELTRDVTRMGRLIEDKVPGTRGLLTSGGEGSALGWSAMPGQGKRFLGEMPSAPEIDRVMGTTGALEPIRVYAGLQHAPKQFGEAEAIAMRVDLAVEDLHRLGAFGRFEEVDGVLRMVEAPRASVHVVSPTSIGFVNPVAASSHEFMAGGNTATVSVQVATRQSASELHRIGRAAATHAQLVEAVNRRIAAIPDVPGVVRPKVLVYGESYGAWTGQRAVREAGGLEGLDRLGADRAMWVGSPRLSPFSRELLAGDNTAVLNVGDLEQAKAVTAAHAATTRVTMLTHDADPMRRFHPRLLVEKPDWLGPAGERGRNVSPHQRYTPGVTFLQTGLDLQEAQYYRKGVLEAKGHDYRSEISYVMRRAYGHEAVSDLQVSRIREWNRQLEEVHAGHQAARAGAKLPPGASMYAELGRPPG